MIVFISILAIIGIYFCFKIVDIYDSKTKNITASICTVITLFSVLGTIDVEDHPFKAFFCLLLIIICWSIFFEMLPKDEQDRIKKEDAERRKGIFNIASLFTEGLICRALGGRIYYTKTIDIDRDKKNQ